MKRSVRFLLVALAAFFAAQAPAAESFEVHEWGTFTSVVSSDGRMLPGLQLEEHALPQFVHSHDGLAPRDKGWSRPVSGVTVKMETPVLYFYSEVPRSVRVEVGFRGGSISQWYPQRIGGEQLPARPATGPRMLPVDFAAKPFGGSAAWQVEVLGPDVPLVMPTYVSEIEGAHWPRARVAGANTVRGHKGETEGFIFYRGLGNFELPLKVKAEWAEQVVLTNTGSDEMPFVWVYEKTPEATRSWVGSLLPGRTAQATLRSNTAVPFAAELAKAGLTPAEAASLIATWRESYFDRPGLRVFWIVPRAFTDEILPLNIEPSPSRLERVLVGRTEVLTPEFESQLAMDFATDGGKRWQTDRYFLVYSERARQLGVQLAAR